MSDLHINILLDSIDIFYADQGTFTRNESHTYGHGSSITHPNSIV